MCVFECQIGRAYFEMVDYLEADHAFGLARLASPYSLEGMDVYSTVLFVSLLCSFSVSIRTCMLCCVEVLTAFNFTISLGGGVVMPDRFDETLFDPCYVDITVICLYSMIIITII